MKRHFIVLGSADALTAFSSCASEAGFAVNRRDIQAFSVEHVAMECLRLIFSKEGAAIIGSLVVAIRAYLRAKSSRRITITKLEPDRVITFDACALSDKELAELLTECREIVADEGSKTSKRLTDRSGQPLAGKKSKKGEIRKQKGHEKPRFRQR